MGVKQQKDPRFQLLKGSGPRRYMDRATGEVITRGEFERRTAKKEALAAPVVGTGKPMAPPMVARNPLGSQDGAKAANPGTGTGATPEPAGAIPHVVVPPPPPGLVISPGEALAGATRIADAAGEAAQALDSGNAEVANQATPFVALAISGTCNALLPPGFKFLALEPEDLQTVVAPGGRIIARHLPVHIDPLREDGKDAIALLSGLGLCGTQIWNNWRDEQKAKEERRLLEQYYRPTGGPGHHEAAAPLGAGQAGAAAVGQASNAALDGVSRPDPAGGAAHEQQPVEENGFDPDAAISQLYAKHAAKRRGLAAVR